MEGVDDLTNAIHRILERMGIDVDSVDSKTLKQLELVHCAVAKETERISEARKIVLHGMPLVRVAELSGISRQTLYNKTILKAYAEHAIREAKIAEGKNEAERLRTIIVRQKETIRKLVLRDGELIEAKLLLREAEQEIASLKFSLDAAESRISKLTKMLETSDEKTRLRIGNR